MDTPVVSVIVPAKNCADQLTLCLQSLGKSTFKDFEIIVVDDASTDETSEIVNGNRTRLIKMTSTVGPARARNQGAKVAMGRILVFVDADVCVQPETLGQFVDTFTRKKDAAAVFGSYDSEPTALNAISQYKNLQHHFVHQDALEDASTFWSGCGAIRRSTFCSVNGFSESFKRPCIEDIELGVRLRNEGYGIVLNKHIQVTHQKRWTFWGMIKTDIRDRAFPWTQLILRERSVPNDLNLKLSQRLSALLAYSLVAALLVAGWFFPILLILPIVLVLAIVLFDWWSLTRRIPTICRIMVPLGIVAGFGVLWLRFQFLALVPLFLLGAIVALNWRFYWFLARARDPLFAAFVLPLHISYYLYSAATFVFAFILHLVKGPKSGVPRSSSDRDMELAKQPLPNNSAVV